MRYGFGVDIGGTTVKIAWFDENGQKLHSWEIPTVRENEGKQILPDIAAALQGFLAERDVNRADVIGIGVGVPGPVDSRGVVNCCVNLGWGNVDVCKELSALTGLPVKAGNDANVAAMGEYWQGSGREFNSMIMATLGTGVGGGIVIEGNLLHGTHGCGGEIGHMVLNRDETEVCGCGNRGCVEQYCSATGLVRLANRRLAEDAAPSVLRQLEKMEAKDVFDAGKQGDAVANEILERYYNCLGEFFANLCVVVDPEVIVLGGGVCKAGQVLLDGIRRGFERFCFQGVKGVKFAVAQLGNDAGSYGAFKLVLDAAG
jgi:glucokinase